MPRFFLPRHGRTHCPGGSDPIPCLDVVVIGEAYMETDFVATANGERLLTPFDEWTIQDASVIDEDGNGLLVVQAGYYLVNAMADWAAIGANPVNAALTVYLGTGASGSLFDVVSGQTTTGDTGSRITRVSDVFYIPSGTSVTVQVYHESLTSLTVAAAYLKLARLSFTAPAPYWAGT
jgi:hypothetical protein